MVRFAGGGVVKIAFGDFCGWDFHVLSVETTPLGGTQSAACYLARALARNHQVFFFSDTTAPELYDGVHCLAWGRISQAELQALGIDVFVSLSAPGNGLKLRQYLGPRTRCVLWTQHRIDQPAVHHLANEAVQDCFDGYVFVSKWQQEEYRLGFGLPPEKMRVIGNAAAPAFVDLFPEGATILSQKMPPPVLAYTSTPFRGLDCLLDVFPAIQAQVPAVRLRVFSSMAVYREAPAAEQAQYGGLYQRCRSIPGVEYVGSLAQPALAREMRGVSMLAYPNTFPETSCIAALEAMASGCRIVTSALGALPETTAGFADLTPLTRDRKPDLEQFTASVVAGLRELQEGGPAIEESLRRQVEYIREKATWAVRAREWESWLEQTDPQ